MTKIERHIKDTNFPIKYYNELYDVVKHLALDRIAKVMEFLNWSYFGSESSPTKEELFETVMILGIYTINKFLKVRTRTQIETGGFVVVVEANGDSFYISVSFEVDSHDNY